MLLSRFKSNDYRIEIGHIGLFQSLVSHITDDTDVKEELRRLIEQKNYARLNDVLEEYSSIPQAKILQRLPRLYGGEEVLKEAESLFVDEETRGILAYLRTLYEQTCQCAQGGKVMLDLGLVNENDYYTGVIFRGYLEGSGETVLSGGRYDHLLRDFGADLPAVGFGVDVDAVTKALMQVNTPQVPPPQVLVFARKGFEIAALHFLRTQVKAGVRCENALCQTLEEALMLRQRKTLQQVAACGPNH